VHSSATSGPSRPRLARALRTAALALAATVVALLVAELAARVALRPQPRLPRAPSAPHEPGLPVLHGIRELNRPHVRGVYKGAFHRTNSLGVRGPELPLEPPPGTFRIALLGDSIAMGEGVEEQDTYAARLAELLSQRDPKRRTEVVNLGISGMNAPHVAHRFEYIGRRYHPDLVVYGYTLNDIEGDAYLDKTPADALERQARLRRFEHSHSALLRALWPRLLVAWSAFFPVHGSEEWELTRNYTENPAAWAAVESALDRIAAESRAQGICALLFVHPVLQDLGWLHAFGALYEQVAAAGRARGFHVVLGIDALRGARASELRFGATDPHPNALGHRRLAEALADAVAALPPECREPRVPTASRRAP
jgi:lysophospholipase L1-like esterase